MAFLAFIIFSKFFGNNFLLWKAYDVLSLTKNQFLFFPATSGLSPSKSGHSILSLSHASLNLCCRELKSNPIGAWLDSGAEKSEIHPRASSIWRASPGTQCLDVIRHSKSQISHQTRQLNCSISNQRRKASLLQLNRIQIPRYYHNFLWNSGKRSRSSTNANSFKFSLRRQRTLHSHLKSCAFSIQQGLRFSWDPAKLF